MTPQHLQFLLRVAPAALASQRDYEVPACITIAQAILESATAAGWGSSVLFRVANNPFGIKYAHFGTRGSGSETRDSGPGTHGSGGETPTPNAASRIPNSESPAPGTLRLGTWDLRPGKEDSKSRIPNSESPVPSTQHAAPSAEAYGAFDAATWEIVNGQKKVIIAQFQRFPNLEEAFTAHARLLRAPRYRPAFAVRDDWKQFAERLGPKTSLLDSEHCGYSTNPSYSAAIIELVSLYLLNDPRALQWLATGKDPGATISTQEPAGRGLSAPETAAPSPSSSRALGSLQAQAGQSAAHGNNQEGPVTAGQNPRPSTAKGEVVARAMPG